MASLFERDIVNQEQFVTLRRQNWAERIQYSRDEARNPKNLVQGGICFGGAMGTLAH